MKFKLTILAAFFLGLLAAPALAQNNQAAAYQSSALTPYGQGDGDQANNAMVNIRPTAGLNAYADDTGYGTAPSLINPNGKGPDGER
jgi:hypothetical protein